MFEVASSRIRIRGSASSARANATSWRWPAESCAAALADLGVEALGQPLDELDRADRAPRPPDLLLVGVGAAEGDVVADRAREQEALLGHDPELAPQAVGLELAQVVAVDQQPAALRVVEARDQLRQRRLAGAGLADQGDRLAGRDVQVDPLERPARLRLERELVGGGVAAAA